MSALLTGNPAGPFVGTATAPVNGDLVTGGSIQVPVQAVLNDAAFLNADKLSKSLGGTVAGDIVVTGKETVSGRRVRGASVALSNADHTVLVTDGNRFRLANPGPSRVITLKSTGTVPTANETIEFLWRGFGASVSNTWSFQREDATVIATFTASASADNTPMWAEFEFDGGVWRLGATSGSAYDDVPARFGVEGGAGA